MSGIQKQLVRPKAAGVSFSPNADVGAASNTQEAIARLASSVGVLESAEFLVAVSSAGLGAERVATNSTSITWDAGTAGQISAKRAALTGDVSASADSNTLTLATVNASPGSFGSASQTLTATVNGKGLVTAMAHTAIAILASQVTDLTEAVQDVIGALFVDSAEIDWSYDDNLNTFTQALITNSVALTKLAQQAALTVLANATNGTANVTALAASSNDTLLRRTSDTLNFGQLTVGMFPANVVTLAKIAQGTALSVLGIAGNAGADYADIAAGTDNHVLRRSGTSVGFGQVNLASTNAVTGQLVAGSMPALTGAVVSAGGALATTATCALAIEINGGGSTITTGVKHYTRFNFAATLTGWTLIGDQSGAIVIDVWKDVFANGLPDNSNSITNGSEPEIAASGTTAEDTNLGDWTTVAVSAGDVLGFNVDSVSSFTFVTLLLHFTKTS